MNLVRAVSDGGVESAAREMGLRVTPATDARLPIAATRAAIVVGSRSRNPADQTITDRSCVRSVQILTAMATITRGALDQLGSHGLRGASPDVSRSRVIVNTGDELASLDVVTGEKRALAIESLVDVHDVTLLDSGEMMVANSGRDEIIHLTADGAEIDRVSLDTFRAPNARRAIDHTRPIGGVFHLGRPDSEDHFHVNQVFLGPDGHRYALVHHVDGFRRLRYAMSRLVGHGDGGILDLDAHRHHALQLRAPHSVRAWGDGLLVLESGAHRIVTLDRFLLPTSTVALPGWGRGADVDPEGQLWVGVSRTRRRYRLPTDLPEVNSVVALNRHLRIVAGRTIDHVDEIWAVHIVLATFAVDLIRATAPEEW